MWNCNNPAGPWSPLKGCSTRLGPGWKKPCSWLRQTGCFLVQGQTRNVRVRLSGACMSGYVSPRPWRTLKVNTSTLKWTKRCLGLQILEGNIYLLKEHTIPCRPAVGLKFCFRVNWLQKLLQKLLCLILMNIDRLSRFLPHVDLLSKNNIVLDKSIYFVGLGTEVENKPQITLLNYVLTFPKKWQCITLNLSMVASLVFIQWMTLEIRRYLWRKQVDRKDKGSLSDDYAYIFPQKWKIWNVKVCVIKNY